MKRFFQISSILAFLSVNLYGQIINNKYSNKSTLSGGLWFKIAVTTDGVYRIDFSKLRLLGLSDPSNPRIFGNNAGQLSYFNNDPAPDDLEEIPVELVKGTDGQFNEGDYLLFYAKGTARWKYDHIADKYRYIPHNYSDTAFYFLTSGTVPGKTIDQETIVSQPENYTSNESDALFVHEQDVENLIRSGREWFQPVSSIHIDPAFNNLNLSEKLKFELRVAARASVSTIFRIYEGTALIKNIGLPGVNLYDENGTYAQICDTSGIIQPSSPNPSFDIQFYNNGEGGAHGWIDRIILQGRAENFFSGPQLQFSDSKSVAPGRITTF